MLGFRSALAVCKACSLEPCSIYFFPFLWSEIGSHLQVFRDYPSETWGTIWDVRNGTQIIHRQGNVSLPVVLFFWPWRVDVILSYGNWTLIFVTGGDIHHSINQNGQALCLFLVASKAACWVLRPEGLLSVHSRGLTSLKREHSMDFQAVGQFGQDWGERRWEKSETVGEFVKGLLSECIVWKILQDSKSNNVENQCGRLEI